METCLPVKRQAEGGGGLRDITSRAACSGCVGPVSLDAAALPRLFRDRPGSHRRSGEGRTPRSLGAPCRPHAASAPSHFGPPLPGDRERVCGRSWDTRSPVPRSLARMIAGHGEPGSRGGSGAGGRKTQPMPDGSWMEEQVTVETESLWFKETQNHQVQQIDQHCRVTTKPCPSTLHLHSF